MGVVRWAHLQFRAGMIGLAARRNGLSAPVRSSQWAESFRRASPVDDVILANARRVYEGRCAGLPFAVMDIAYETIVDPGWVRLRCTAVVVQNVPADWPDFTVRPWGWTGRLLEALTAAIGLEPVPPIDVPTCPQLGRRYCISAREQDARFVRRRLSGSAAETLSRVRGYHIRKRGAELVILACRSWYLPTWRLQGFVRTARRLVEAMGA